MERPDSPCVALCSTALGDEICQGCGRTFVEVAMWVAMPDAEKERVWQRLEKAWADKGMTPPWVKQA